jgi:hypothetical protein
MKTRLDEGKTCACGRAALVSIRDQTSRRRADARRET